MKTLKLSLCVFSLLILNSTAQNVKIEWQPPLPATIHYNLIQISGQPFIYGVAGGGSFINIARFDSSMAFIDRREFKLNTAKRTIEKLFSFNNRIVLISSRDDSKTKMNYLYAQYLSTEGTLEGEPVLIDEASAESRRKTSTYEFRCSPDSQKILFFHRHHHRFFEWEKKKSTFKLLDGRFNIQWEKSWDMEYATPYELESFELDEKNRLYILVKLRIDWDKTGKERYTKVGSAVDFISLKTRYLIKMFSAESDLLPEYEVKTDQLLNGTTVTALNLTLSNNQMILTGFYSRDAEHISGCFTRTVDAVTGKILSEHVKDLSSDNFRNFPHNQSNRVIPSGYSEQIKQIDMEDIHCSYKIRHIVHKNDGSRYVVAEQLGDYGHHTGPHGLIYHKVYGDILIVNIDKEGKIEWDSRIQKYQVTHDDEPQFSEIYTEPGTYCSFIMVPENEALYFVYNDAPENAALESKNIFNTKSGFDQHKNITVTVHMNSKGNIVKTKTEQVDLDRSERKTVLIPLVQLAVSGKIIVQKNLKSKFEFSYGVLRILNN